MVERQGPWPGATSPPGWTPAAPSPLWPPQVPAPPGWVPAASETPARPAGMSPLQPLRPAYREPHPVATAPVLAGITSTLIWLALFGGIGRDLVSCAWWTLVAAVTAWVVALVLTILGDRGVATGVAVAAGFGLSIATVLVTVRWITSQNWPMW